jgi:hypothetical protein
MIGVQESAAIIWSRSVEEGNQGYGYKHSNQIMKLMLAESEEAKALRAEASDRIDQ